MNLHGLKVLLSENWLGTTIGIIGLVFAVYTYLKSRRISRVSWRFSGVRLIGDHSQLGSKLAVSYDGNVIPRLTLSKVFLWNSGTETIRRADVAEPDRLRVELGSEARVLSATVEQVVRKVNEISVETRETGTYVDFAFLDPGDGARIAVLHTGDKTKPSMAGTITGMPKGLSGGDPFPDVPEFRFRRGPQLNALLIVNGLIGGSLVGAAIMAAGSPNRTSVATWASGVVGFLFLVAVVALPFGLRPPFPRALTENGAPDHLNRKSPQN